MNTYSEFKTEYVRLLTKLLASTDVSYPRVYIGTPASNDIAKQLVDMEEKHPSWAERVDDWLADEALPEEPMIGSYEDFHRQYVCIVRQLRKKPAPSASEEMRLSSELYALTDVHPNVWKQCVEEWLKES